jgi:hypothetical protein
MLLSAAAAAWIWLAVLPVIRASTPDFSPDLSLQGLWTRSQRAINLGLFPGQPMDWTLGYFGGRDMAERLIAEMKREWHGMCDCGHPGGPLAMITNHAPPDASDHAAHQAFWSAWWETHRHLSQEEWVQAGFAAYSISARLPPVPEDWPALVGVLGATGERLGGDFKFTPALRYNAYRWLRDSGFDPVTHALNLEAAGREQRLGLAEFQKWERQFRRPVPGRFAFADTRDWGWSMSPDHLPKGLLPGTQITAAAVLAVLFLLGLILLLRRTASS